MSENVTAYAPYDSEGNRLPLACPVEYLYDENGYGAGKRRFGIGGAGSKKRTRWPLERPTAPKRSRRGKPGLKGGRFIGKF